ncbi:TetR/AcrR family transcriptional regulator [Allosaccharopolyspora coralli]|uniref:TetR/AcrR family transcriptional regulator n=1 Tax=Allosaccharopolyspora coralli TaxID=2665642 RepID=UPI001E3D414E|nr:TetR/AcrR family transcriptional regulator [Allosaccharopolyspora coralli]
MSNDSSATTTGAPARETARRAKTRERLLDAAYRQFCAHGIHGTSIEAITDDADFTRGAFYSNFASKEELFLALTEREHHARLEGLRSQFTDVTALLGQTGGKPAPETIENAIADILASQPKGRQWCVLDAEFRLLAMRDPQVAGRYLQASQDFRRRLAELVDTAFATVGLRFVIDSLRLTGVLVDQFESAMQEAILSGAEDAEQAARDNVMRLLPQLVHSLTEVSDEAEPSASREADARQ